MKSIQAVENKDSRLGSVLFASDEEAVELKRRKHKYFGPLTAAWKIFADFSSQSTLHGVKYLGERNRHWSERIFWIIAFLTSVVGCFWMIANIYDKWQYLPVIVTFEEKTTPIWHIPFPAVTICPKRKILCRMREPLPEHEEKVFDALGRAYEAKIINKEKRNTSNLAGEEIIPLLDKISPGLKKFMISCRWKYSTKKDCTKLFTSMIKLMAS